MLICIPAICDLITGTLHLIALNYISTSGYQMMTGGSIVATFLMSILFLRQSVIKTQLGGSLLAFLGISVVGMANIFAIKNADTNSSVV